MFKISDFFFVCNPQEIPQEGIYSLVAVKKEIIDNEELKNEMENYLNRDKCEGAHLLKINGLNEKYYSIERYYLCLFVQYWG